MSDPVTRYAIQDNAAWITLARPAQRNALSAELVSALHGHMAQANADPAARCIVLAAEGKAFCAGADLKAPPGETIEGKPSASVTYADLLKSVDASAKPVIAAVQGAAFGGGIGLVAAADIAIASCDAPFSFSEVRLGVIPAVISVFVVRKLGRHQAMRWFLNGRRFDGAMAQRLGLVHEAVPIADLEQTVRAEIAAICQGGPNAVSEAKRLVQCVETWDIEQGLEETTRWSAELFRSDEGLEGQAAFRQRRPPAWVGGQS